MKKLCGVAELEIDYRIQIPNPVKIKQPQDAIECFKEFYSLKTIGIQEQLLVMYLNRGNVVLGIYRHSMGGINGTLADVRLMLAVALKIGASGMILSHNHPSGNLKPSDLDIGLTIKIKEAAKYHDIELVDHLIVDSKFDFTSIASDLSNTYPIS